MKLIFCPAGRPKSCTAGRHCSSAPKGQKASSPHSQEGTSQKINQRASPFSLHLESPATPKVQQRAPSLPIPPPPCPPPPDPSEAWQKALEPPLSPPPSHPQEPAADKEGKKTPSPPWPPPPPDVLLTCPTGEGCWGALAYDPSFPPPPAPVFPILNEVQYCTLPLEEIRREVKLKKVEMKLQNWYFFF